MRQLPTALLAFSLAAVTGCINNVGAGAPTLQRPNHRAPTAGTHKAPPSVPGTGDTSVTPDAPAEPRAPLPPWDYNRSIDGLRNGRIAGHVGPTAIQAPTDLARVYDDGYFTQIDVYALRGDGTRVMLQLAIENGNSPFLQPGVGARIIPGGTHHGATIMSLGCSGPDSGDGVEDPFDGTDFDEEPCDIGIDTEQDPDSPQDLDVMLSVTFADADGNCEDVPNDNGDGSGVLPDEDGDGDGDLPGCGDDVGTPDDGDTPDADTPVDGDPTDPATPPDDGDTPDPATPPAGDDVPGTDPGTIEDGYHPLATATFTLVR